MVPTDKVSIHYRSMELAIVKAMAVSSFNAILRSLPEGTVPQLVRERVLDAVSYSVMDVCKATGITVTVETIADICLVEVGIYGK